MQNSLNILGCYPEGLEILFDLAAQSKKMNLFHVFENQLAQKEIDTEYQSFRKVFYHLKESEKSLVDIIRLNPLAFGVIGIDSKPEVFNYFKTFYGVNIKDFLNLIHPSSVIAPSAELNFGVQVDTLCSISAYANIGFGVNIKRNSSIGHHTILKDYCTINPGVIISGKVEIGQSTMLGTGTIVKDHVKIGSNSIIGMGSVVVKDIPSNVIAFGNPCKVVRKR